jgi:transcriptional regulator with XRE-family HTH domain
MQNKAEPTTTYRALVGRLLAIQREALGLDQGELAQKLNMSQSAWSRIETGQSNLSVDQLSLVAQALKTRPEVILKQAEDSRAQLQRRGVKVLSAADEADNAGLFVLGAAALGALLIALSKGK